MSMLWLQDVAQQHDTSKSCEGRGQRRSQRAISSSIIGLIVPVLAHANTSAFDWAALNCRVRKKGRKEKRKWHVRAGACVLNFTAWSMGNLVSPDDEQSARRQELLKPPDFSDQELESMWRNDVNHKGQTVGIMLKKGTDVHDPCTSGGLNFLELIFT
eukprot:1156765-Pelagomonas_calceolata.AAC.2